VERPAAPGSAQKFVPAIMILSPVFPLAGVSVVIAGAFMLFSAISRNLPQSFTYRELKLKSYNNVFTEFENFALFTSHSK